VQLPLMDTMTKNDELFLEIYKTRYSLEETCTQIQFTENEQKSGDGDENDDENESEEEKNLNKVSRFLSRMSRLNQNKADFYVPVIIVIVSVFITLSTGCAILFIVVELVGWPCSQMNRRNNHQKTRISVVREDSTQFDQISDYSTTLAEQSSNGAYTIGDYLRRIESSPPTTINVIQQDDLTSQLISPPSYMECVKIDKK
jgi:hypothetical protein